MHDPYERVGDVKDVRVSETFLAEKLEPMVSDGVERSTLTMIAS